MVQVETSVEWEMKEARERKTGGGRQLEREREREERGCTSLLLLLLLLSLELEQWKLVNFKRIFDRIVRAMREKY